MSMRVKPHRLGGRLSSRRMPLPTLKDGAVPIQSAGQIAYLRKLKGRTWVITFGPMSRFGDAPTIRGHVDFFVKNGRLLPRAGGWF